MLVIDDVTAAGETWRPDPPSGPARAGMKYEAHAKCARRIRVRAAPTQSIRRLHRLRRRPGNLVVVTDGR